MRAQQSLRRRLRGRLRLRERSLCAELLLRSTHSIATWCGLIRAHDEVALVAVRAEQLILDSLQLLLLRDVVQHDLLVEVCDRLRCRVRLLSKSQQILLTLGGRLLHEIDDGLLSARRLSGHLCDNFLIVGKLLRYQVTAYSGRRSSCPTRSGRTSASCRSRLLSSFILATWLSLDDWVNRLMRWHRRRLDLLRVHLGLRASDSVRMTETLLIRSKASSQASRAALGRRLHRGVGAVFIKVPRQRTLLFLDLRVAAHKRRITRLFVQFNLFLVLFNFFGVFFIIAVKHAHNCLLGVEALHAWIASYQRRHAVLSVEVTRLVRLTAVGIWHALAIVVQH